MVKSSKKLQRRCCVILLPYTLSLLTKGHIHYVSHSVCFSRYCNKFVWNKITKRCTRHVTQISVNSGINAANVNVTGTGNGNSRFATKPFCEETKILRKQYIVFLELPSVYHRTVVINKEKVVMGRSRSRSRSPSRRKSKSKHKRRRSRSRSRERNRREKSNRRSKSRDRPGPSREKRR